MARGNEADQGQPGTRRPGTLYDQHNRPWSASIDKKSGYPVGVIQPKGWRAPWLPPQGPEIFRFNKDEPTRFTLNYEWLLEQRLQDLKQYDEERQKAALVRGWDPTDPEKQEALDALVGARDKFQSPEVIAACMQGNAWILGLSPVVDKRLEKFIPKKVDRKAALLSKFADYSTIPDEETAERLMDLEEEHDPEVVGGQRQRTVPVAPKETWNQFAAARMKEGKTMAEASVLWKAKKAAA
jgi:hypothetical protein